MCLLSFTLICKNLLIYPVQVDCAWTSFKIDKGLFCLILRKFGNFRGSNSRTLERRRTLMPVERQADWHLSIAGLSVGGELRKYGSFEADVVLIAKLN